MSPIISDIHHMAKCVCGYLLFFFFFVYLFDGLEFLETYTQISWHRVFPFSCSFANMSEVCFEAMVGPEQHYGEYKNSTSTKHP